MTGRSPMSLSQLLRVILCEKKTVYTLLYQLQVKMNRKFNCPSKFRADSNGVIIVYLCYNQKRYATLLDTTIESGRIPPMSLCKMKLLQ